MLKSADGSIYKGYWKNDFKDGEGNLISANGDQYQGMWKNDK